MANAMAADSAVSHHGRWTSAKRQGGPDPPETKVGVTFLKRAATIERAWHSGCYHRDMPRRFPPIEESSACFIVRDHDTQALAYVYFENEPGRRSSAKLLSRDEAFLIAVNIAKLPSVPRQILKDILRAPNSASRDD